MASSAALPTWREAWTRALYGPQGFYRRHRPAAHFRTSVHVSPAFAEAILALADRIGADEITDLGSGGGELLTALRAADANSWLTGIDVGERPPGLPDDIDWRADLPDRLTGLVVANEWLDTIPCDVVEVDEHGTTRMVHVDPATGAERLGVAVDDPWLTTWWPLTEPGQRAEIGAPRDRAWADAVGRLEHGIAVAIDYGHTAANRPPTGSLTAYQDGLLVETVPDGSRDITAHVALDSLTALRVETQREALHRLGIHGDRPPLDLAHSDPQAYVAALSRASAAAELTATGGLGDFAWVWAAAGIEIPA